MISAIGLMSGTSFDGVDAACILSDGVSQLEMVCSASAEYPSAFRDKLRSVHKAGIQEMLEIEDEMTDFHIHAVKKVCTILKGSGYKLPKLIGFHGQTALYIPQKRLICQIGNPHKLAENTKMDVVSDFRRRDLAVGGLGAPLVPIFHKALVAELEQPVALLNIGGVANITYIHNDELIAFDVGPGNAPIDDLIYKKLGWKYDEDGKVSSSGKPDEQLASAFCEQEYFRLKPPKALDRNAFKFDFLNEMAVEEGAATLCMIVALAAKRAIDILPSLPKKLLVCGGGRKNASIMNFLKILLPCEVLKIDEIKRGESFLDGDMIEAQAFAYLAIRVMKGLPISFPKTTSTPHPVVGGSITFYSKASG